MRDFNRLQIFDAFSETFDAFMFFSANRFIYRIINSNLSIRSLDIYLYNDLYMFYDNKHYLLLLFSG